MNKFKMAALLAALCLVAAGATALEVNKQEIESAGGENAIQFENYTGPHSVIDSLAAIKAIGSGMGQSVASNVNKSGTFGTNSKYSVIHAVDATTNKGLDADIFIIGPDATVDHIKNVRYIIAAYLTSAYGYKASDASTIATFVTVYNAVYRGKLDIYKSKYKAVVTNNLTSDKCGMSIKWSEWAGRSQIVIPLYDLNGGLSTVDTSVISDKEVVKSMKEEDNKGVDERKNMVDIKEREADTATEKAQTAQKTATTEQKKADDQQKKADTAKKEADTAKKEADTAKKEAAKEPDNKEKQKAATEKEKTAEEKQTTATEEQKKADDQQKKADNASNEAQKQQEVADKKQAEAQAERTEIAKDQQKLLQDALAEAANKNAVIGLRMADDAKDMSGMVKVDGITGETIRESPLTSIRGRTILPAGFASTSDSTAATTDTATKTNTASSKATTTDTTATSATMMYMAICGENNAKTGGTVKLCLLDGNTMEIQKASDEVVAEESVLVQNGKEYYCVIQDGKNWVVGKYDATLKLLVKSPVSVTAGTPITVTPNGLVVTGSNGKVLLLKVDDLTSITKEPAALEK